MVKLIATVTMTVLLNIVASNGQQSLRDPSAGEIERLEREWNLINEISDAEGKQRLLTEDSYHVGPSGRLYNKAQDLEAMRLSREQKQTDGRVLKFEISNMRIRLYGEVAVVTATGQSITTRNGVQQRGKAFRVIHVWEKHDGKWLLSVDQVTGVN